MTPSQLDVSHHFVELGGLRMHYVEAGAGPTVVLLHGFPENWWSWRHQIMPLAEAGLRVIAPDLRGYGETDQHGPYDLDTLCGDVAKLIESLGVGRSARIVGHDWGGALAWHLAATHPESVERLAVLNCPHPVVLRNQLLKSPKQLKKSWYFFFFQIPFVADYLLTKDDARETMRLLKGNAVDRTNFGDDELRPFKEGILRPGAATAMIGWYRAMLPTALASMRKPLPRVEAETLLLWGKDDLALDFDVLVPGTERYAPRLQVVPIDGAGHFVQSDAPAKVNPPLIEFLTRGG